MPMQISRKLFSVHDYHRMVDAGILHEHDRVELLRGEIVLMSPIGSRYNAAVMRAIQSLVGIVSGRAIVGSQGSVRLDEYAEPQPDIYLLRPREDFYASQHPGPSDILLVIEMADASLEYDLQVKTLLYAETGVPEYWVADVRTDCVIVHSNLDKKSYTKTETFTRGMTLVPSLLSDCAIPADILLP
jgi:Uma2 family endonuclease